MNTTNKIGLRVAGITLLVFVVLFSLYMGGRALLKGKNEEEIVSNIPPNLEQRTKDTDGDGIADLYETTYYNTDPNKADTDGDGVNDLDEILAGRDPLTPGPGDVNKPATGSQVSQTDTFTQKYLATLPEDTAREDILDQVKLEAFVEDSKGKLLPEVTVKTSNEEGKEAVKKYLDSVSGSHNEKIQIVTSTDIESAFRTMVNTQNAKPLKDIINILNNNISELEKTAAPQEVADLHTKMLAAAKSLKTNAELLLYVNQDFVGGLIGAKNIENLGPVFQEMSQSVKELEEKYNLE